MKVLSEFNPAQYHVQVYDKFDGVWEFAEAFDSQHAAEVYAQDSANLHGYTYRVVIVQD